ncbi:MAG: efflux RND transporter permease subunit [Ardenticatenaceae bacterium]|nr:efflux RND transporter permease subunit [Ardenticatenaceae bacterium]
MFTALFDRITRASVRYHWVTVAVALVVSIIGLFALTDLNLELLPRIEFPQTVVIVQWPDSESSEQFAEEITIPLEEAMRGVEGVVNIESTTSQSFSFLIVRNDFGLNQDAIVEDIRAAADTVDFPAGVEAPQILNFSLSDLPVVIASVSSPDLTLPELKALVETELRPQLEGISDISRVTVSGGQELPQDLVAPAGEEEPAPAPTAEPTAVPTPTVEPTPDPAQLPDAFVQGLSAAGLNITRADEITPELMQQLVNFGGPAIQSLALLTPDNLRALPPETIAWLPPELLGTLDADLLAELDAQAAEFGGAGALLAAEVAAAEAAAAEAAAGETETELPQVEPVALPDSWVAAGAAAGAELATTADVTPEVMQGIVAAAPALLAELTPEMWRALDPAGVAIALPAVADTLDAGLLAQLQVIVLRAAGEAPEAVALPASWVAGAAAAGVTITTTADLTPEFVTNLVSLAPQSLAELTPAMVLAASPEVQAALPAEYLATLDEGLQQTLAIIAVRHAQYLAAQAAEAPPADETAEVEATPEPEVDPARLPDIMIQGAAASGLTLEFAQDLTPDLMRLFAGFPQGEQFLALLTPDNLRLLPPESIALLPAGFVETLDADLRAELDALAADYGGAGALALQEAEEAAAAAEGAPPLSGMWTQAGPDGTPLFATAADLLNNPFGVSAAALLNQLPTTPGIEDVPQLMADLTPDVLQYLVENDDTFLATLSPTVLELMSPETLTFLLDTYPDAFPADLAERLRGIAGGEVAVFIPEASITRTDGDPSLIISVYKAGDANTVTTAHAVFDTLDAFAAEQAAQGQTVNVAIAFEQATFIEDSIAGVSREGVLGALFAVVIILIFLSGRREGHYKLAWRSTAVTAVSIPLSVLAAFVLMRWVPPTIGVWLHGLAENSNSAILDFVVRLFPTSVSLNIMTLSGLTVAVGRVVDDSIVVLENIYRFIQKGDDPRHAVTEGTKEVAIAIFSSTATTIAVFLPLGLIGGLIGSFFLPFGLTVTYALAASFVVAITVVPALAFLLIRKEHLPEESETWMQRVYTPTLVWTLKHRAVTMILAFALFFGSIYLLTLLPTSFIPSLGEPTVNVSIELPAGTGMIETNDQVKAFEAQLQELDGIETIQTEVGGSGGTAALFGGGGVSQNLANLTITPESIDVVDTLTQEVRDLAEETFGADNVTVSAASQTGFGGFSLIVTGDSLADLIAVSDDVKQTLESLDIDGDGRPDITNVTSNVDTAAVGGEGTIIRVDGQPAISFSGELETENTLGVTSAAKAAVAEMASLPAGAQVTEGFDSEQQVQGFRSMVIAILYSVVLVYLVMALTFRSLIHPFTILFSLPFALVGAAVALYITDSVLGISAMIGLMMLVGIVVTNAIVLMELLLQLRARGESAYDALIEAGRTRLRPIWMTALTAVLALIPLAISTESGAVIASELARAVIGGLLFSTALTLIVVPVVYSLLDSVSGRLRRQS